MALKDWKLKKNTTMFQNNSLYHWREDGVMRDLWVDKEFDYFVVTSDGLRKVFDKLSDAVKYAKDYMSKH